ncbi:glucose-1-phosphate adenylyltransferase [Alkalithermobacter thermoalcaliphilus JW-YL-7 = DSM 7308]|uniref:Glucose-1-phosphate adenylyltransferase n=1 Tax=Alkalithermobacter thermoalcaliphilus JW-YL-7 = DSM 7308 TaxID=1121328 RepID=A0A150FQ95_CLOPD|nr:Glucose-1-phosphate adenylyltransferase [[Clostridium] paradoxum JW-YL-7 = DSM 7308]SHK62245.1 glucose-1-phosphate adenylyltransferase [[Clostridium] paradoxum JW-YL-7 = DSM 7308]
MARQKKEVIAMLLAGGQGSRLNELTKKIAKPAVPFGGKYRIIDFTLSNCSNSGIDTVGVLTQYQPLELNNHIGIGSSWDLDRKNGGVSILQPYTGKDGGRWYKGTANAIYENMDFIDSYDPEYVLILSGDHIYKMNYSLMLKQHKKNNAQATIAVIQVPFEEASRFGIMNINEEGKIIEFEEKPKNPKSNLASMGIYIFNWSVLREYLIDDEKDKDSSNDFGKNIIPKMLSQGVDLYTYVFDGYWKDVGTIQSYWEANMDLLKEDNKLDLYDSSWKIYSNNPVNPPHYVSSTGSVKSSLLNEGCIIHGEVENSILFPGVHIGKNSKIIQSVIMPGAFIEDNVIIKKGIVMSNVRVKEGRTIESKNEISIVTDEL